MMGMARFYESSFIALFLGFCALLVFYQYQFL